jgi:Zn-dependent protease/CBS domain-containing protein
MWGLEGSMRVAIHYTFLFLLPLLAFSFARAFLAAADWAGLPAEQIHGSPLVWGFGVAIALFATVLIHELAHALYAIHKGGKVKAITLMMTGGVSHIAEPPHQIRDEAVMALVGPIASFLLGLLFYGAHVLLAGAGSFSLSFALFFLGQLNLFLAAFNLLPAFPMDGGRILRATLATRLGLVRGTRIAAGVGKVFALAFAAYGLFTMNFILLLIAFFVFVGAEAESGQVSMQMALTEVHVRELMTARAESVEATRPVAQAAEQLLNGRRLALPVTEEGRPIGVITLREVQAVPPERRDQVLVKELTRTAPPLSPGDDVWRALKQMSELDVPQLPVAQDGTLLGVLNRLDILEGLQFSEIARTTWSEGRPPRRRIEV